MRFLGSMSASLQGASRVGTEQIVCRIPDIKPQVWRNTARFRANRPASWRESVARATTVPVRLIPALLVAALLPAAVSASAAGTVLVARGSWAAIDRGPLCEAVGRSARIAAKGKVQATAGFAFSRDRSRWGEFHARLRRVVRPGSSVVLTVGRSPFLLAARGDRAWSRGPRQEQAIIAAVRAAGGMRVEGRDGAGRRFSDPYALDGAPTAIDAAAARCSVRAAGKKG